MNEQPKMTQEEVEAMMKSRKEEWDKFLVSLKSKSDEPVTKGELVTAIEFISEEIQGIGEMASVSMHNTNVLNNNFQHLVSVLQGGGQQPSSVTKTKSGIILP